MGTYDNWDYCVYKADLGAAEYTPPWTNLGAAPVGDWNPNLNEPDAMPVVNGVHGKDRGFEVKIVFPGPEYAVALVAIFALLCFVWTVGSKMPHQVAVPSGEPMRRFSGRGSGAVIGTNLMVQKNEKRIIDLVLEEGMDMVGVAMKGNVLIVIVFVIQSLFESGVNDECLFVRLFELKLYGICCLRLLCME